MFNQNDADAVRWIRNETSETIRTYWKMFSKYEAQIFKNYDDAWFGREGMTWEKAQDYEIKIKQVIHGQMIQMAETSRNTMAAVLGIEVK